jgi:hypothetical protein
MTAAAQRFAPTVLGTQAKQAGNALADHLL